MSTVAGMDMRQRRRRLEAITIAPVREIVIVIKDLYLQADADAAAGVEGIADSMTSGRAGAGPSSRGSSSQGEAPGMRHLGQLGNRTVLTHGWRSWVAHWLGVPQFAVHPPASVAALAPGQVRAESGVSPDRAVWLATPLHLIAGLTSVHVDRRGILRLSSEEAGELAAGFVEDFRGSGFELHALEGGELLLSGPAAATPSVTTEPARMLLTSVAEGLPAGEGAAAMRRLGAEIEMWLHGHPLNARRASRGAPTVATLWVWGGGARPIAHSIVSQRIADAAYGSDAYVQGLWRLAGGEARSMPVDWTTMIGEPRAGRALAVVEVAELLHANHSWRLMDALAEIDRRLVSPSLAAIRHGGLERLTLVANDRCLTLRGTDRWRLWRWMRRLRSDIEGLM